VNVRAICEGQFRLGGWHCLHSRKHRRQRDPDRARAERQRDAVRTRRARPHRGTITVTCTEAAEPDQTRVSVTYEVTSLSPEGAVFVEELEATYDEFLEDLRQRIVALGGAVDAGPAAGQEVGPMTAAPDRVRPGTARLERRRER
jgi:hypothetical protein